MGTYSKLYRNVMAFSFAAFLGCVVLLNAVTPDHPFSSAENRVLEQIPTLSFQRLLSGQFTADFERYIADQFALRDMWIGVRASIERAIGKRDSNGVFIASDASLIPTFRTPDEQDLQTKIEAVNTFVASHPDLNTYFMLVPNAVEIHADKLPPKAPVEVQSKYLRQAEEALDRPIHFVNVYDALYSHRDEYLYYHTDHHWTTQGAFYAYQRLADEMGETPQPREAFLITPVTQSFYGTSQSKSGLRNLMPDTVELYIPKVGMPERIAYLDNNKVADTPYNLDKLAGKDKYAVFLDGNHGLVKISSNSAKDRRLLVIKDSYANALIPFLTAHFGEIFVVDLRYYDDDLPDLITQNRVTDLLLLYNLDTFCTDGSVLALSDYAAEALAERQSPASRRPGLGSGGGESTTPTDLYHEVFKNDLFIGDSISEGLSYYEFLPEDVVAANKGLDFRSVRDDLELVKERQPQSIYVLLGINVIEQSTESLVEEYTNFVRDLRQVAPGAEIYIQSILPVEPWVREQKPGFDQAHIDECNSRLKEMAQQEHVGFVNIAEVAEAELHEGDGIHFKADFYPLWLDYLVRQTKTGFFPAGS